MNYYEMIMKCLVAHKEIPLCVRKDVLNRSYDYLSMDNSEEDDYIKRQYEYLLQWTGGNDYAN